DELCGLAGISLNKNAIPFDPQTPAVTSGIRVGSAATTTQGMGTAQMKQIAEFIVSAIKSGADQGKLAKIKSQVAELCAKFPVYPEPK
ncbi:MAG: serine hydroxymethyltransferase, partial [Actinobacteria bacterium]|nr:serine hydroxymethyltransferase [Actinomycetota bacterium]